VKAGVGRFGFGSLSKMLKVAGWICAMWPRLGRFGKAGTRWQSLATFRKFVAGFGQFVLVVGVVLLGLVSTFLAVFLGFL
jgi:hypothetical protein